MMVEPIQGEGGVNVPPPGYLKSLRELCDEKGILLIFDEVQTGMGRTGTFFAYQQEDVVPHVMTVAKGIAGGLPMGVLMADEQTAASLVPGTHASTFGGNPVAAAAGLAVLSILVDDGIIQAVEPLASHFMQGLEKIAARYPKQVKEVRGRGWLVGMELTVPGKPIVDACMAKGLLINCTMDTVLRFIPPLVITLEETEEALKVLGQAFEETFGG